MQHKENLDNKASFNGQHNQRINHEKSSNGRPKQFYYANPCERNVMITFMNIIKVKNIKMIF
jgi:hypothetical protein